MRYYNYYFRDMDKKELLTPLEAGEKMTTEVERLFAKLREAKKQLDQVNAEKAAALKALAESSDGLITTWHQERI